MTEFSGKGPRRWLDSADSCLVHTNPPRPPNHTDAHFRPHSKCCPQGQPDPRAAGRLQVAWVSDWRTPSRAGDRVQVALRRSGARERQAPARRGSHPAALRRARRLTRAAHHVRPWRARNAGGPARLPEPRGWWPGRPVPRARGHSAEVQASLSQSPGSIPGFRLSPRPVPSPAQGPEALRARGLHWAMWATRQSSPATPNRRPAQQVTAAPQEPKLPPDKKS